jgi:hypothetical protein
MEELEIKKIVTHPIHSSNDWRTKPKSKAILTILVTKGWFKQRLIYIIISILLLVFYDSISKIFQTELRCFCLEVSNPYPLDNPHFPYFICTISTHTYILLTLYPQRGSRYISNLFINIYNNHLFQCKSNSWWFVC